jgi:MFS family permease
MINKLSIKEKINHLLEEIRIVLPGTQAILGFQLVAVFSNGFDRLSDQLKFLHLGSLLLITLTTILLMAVSAYDRIVDQDNDTEHFHSFSTVMILLALFLLGIGLAGDLFVVAIYITESYEISLLISAGILTFAFTLWFGITNLKRMIYKNA